MLSKLCRGGTLTGRFIKNGWGFIGTIQPSPQIPMGKEIHPQESHQIRKRPSKSRTDLKVSKQKHGNQCCPNLGFHGIRARTHKGLDFEVLFQILKEDLNLPAVFINGGDGRSSPIHVVG